MRQRFPRLHAKGKSFHLLLLQQRQKHEPIATQSARDVPADNNDV